MIEKGGNLELFAGPCSITKKNIGQISQLAGIQVRNLKGEEQPALWGTRIVGLKSRTSIDLTGEGMGIDFPVFMQNVMILTNGGSPEDFIIPPSVEMAKRVIRETGMVVGTEVMEPSIQVPCYERTIPDSKMLLWSPSVQQLGWPILPMAIGAQKHNWQLGVKNGKWLGIPYNEAKDPEATIESDMERTWLGLLSFALSAGLKTENTILIHRGVTIPEKGNMRSALVHEVAQRVKNKAPKGTKLYFDPSHSYGPKMRDDIVQGTIDAMLMRNGNDWLYDGALIEVGNSTTDTGQHITINEMECLAQELAHFRTLKVPQDRR